MKNYIILLCIIFSLGNVYAQNQTIRILQFNIWQEGTKVPGGYDGIVDQILASKADLITFSEVRNYKNSRFCDRIVKSLKKKGETFYSFYSYDSGILSRFPIIDSLTVYPEKGDHGSIHKAIIKVNDRELAVYTAHLDYLNCTYYDIKGYDGSTWKKRPPLTDLDSIMSDNIASKRDDAIKAFIEESQKDKAKNRIVFIGGDFNEPSHLDWTEATKNLYDRNGLIIPWTVSKMLEKAGFKDAYRVKHPDPVNNPGITFPADCPEADISKLTWAPESDERERIDFIYYTSDRDLKLKDAVVWGPQGSICRSQRVLETERTEIGTGVWPTDHKAVLATFSLNNPTSQTIPLGGNTYITQKSKTEEEKVTNNGLINWNNQEAQYSVFFRTAKTGSLSLSLKYNLSKPAKIKVLCAGKTFNVNLPAGTNTKAFLGTINKVDTGYIRVDFKGVERQGDFYAEATDLIVEGTAVNENIVYVNDFSFYWGRRGPSVHLRYNLPENETTEWFYNEITVPKGGDPVGTYYMSNGFGQGYFGMQVNSPTERRILFSVWSPFETDNPNEIPESHHIKLLKKGENVQTGTFGNEGSGGQSYLIYPWKTGNTYKFLTQIKPNGKGSTEYTSYFYTPDEQKWILIASFSRPLTDTYYTNPHSFLENFHNEAGYLTRKALYSNQWARTKDGKWINVSNEAKFSADETAHKEARMDYKGGIEGNSFFLQNCGFFSDYTPIGTLFSKESKNTAPNIDFNKLPK